jgi:hypothetical protein
MMRSCVQYCSGDFVTWDPMITTFPGLYFGEKKRDISFAACAAI